MWEIGAQPFTQYKKPNVMQSIEHEYVMVREVTLTYLDFFRLHANTQMISDDSQNMSAIMPLDSQKYSMLFFSKE